MSPRTFIVRKAHVLDAFGTTVHDEADVWVQDGIVKAIGPELTVEVNTEAITGNKLVVSPGYIDTLAYASEPGQEQDETLEYLCEAALAGGYTQVALSAQSFQAFDQAAVLQYITEAGKRNGISLLPVAGISQQHKGEKLAELIHLHKAGAFAFGEGDTPLANTDLLVKALQYAQHTGMRVFHRSEDHWLAQFGLMHEGNNSTMVGLRGIPSLAETLMLRRDLELLRHVGGKLHVSSISTAESVSLIANAQAEGLDVTCSVDVANLLFTDEELLSLNSVFKLSPPLRTAADRSALLAGITSGTITTISSHHLPVHQDSKEVEFDHASPGQIMLQTAVPALLQVLDFKTITKLLCSGSAKVMGLNVPQLEVGAAANLTVLDLGEAFTFTRDVNRSATENSAMFNKTLKGAVKLAVYHTA